MKKINILFPVLAILLGNSWAQGPEVLGDHNSHIYVWNTFGQKDVLQRKKSQVSEEQIKLLVAELDNLKSELNNRSETRLNRSFTKDQFETTEEYQNRLKLTRETPDESELDILKKIEVAETQLTKLKSEKDVPINTYAVVNFLRDKYVYQILKVRMEGLYDADNQKISGFQSSITDFGETVEPSIFTFTAKLPSISIQTADAKSVYKYSNEGKLFAIVRGVVSGVTFSESYHLPKTESKIKSEKTSNNFGAALVWGAKLLLGSHPTDAAVASQIYKDSSDKSIVNYDHKKQK
ncbi:MAG: hypothetical protein HC904_15290 [Blastochloris sp.]|nr:hypothetical protein [Blastochloris sp.]